MASGRTDKLPEGMDLYLEQLTFINGLWNSRHNRDQIIKKLVITYPDLDRITAKSRFEDALTWFYLDDNIKKDAWRNVLFDILIKLADATILSATEPKHYKIAKEILKDAYYVKGLNEKEVEQIPESAFSKPIKLYSTELSHFKDLPQKTDRRLLAKLVDEMNLSEDQKIKIRQDMAMEPRELFGDYEQEKED